MHRPPCWKPSEPYTFDTRNWRKPGRYITACTAEEVDTLAYLPFKQLPGPVTVFSLPQQLFVPVCAWIRRIHSSYVAKYERTHLWRNHPRGISEYGVQWLEPLVIDESLVSAQDFSLASFAPSLSQRARNELVMQKSYLEWFFAPINGGSRRWKVE